MGKSLRGKECGKGICQRKDGLYYARFVWSCVILFLSTGVPGNRQRTVPMIPTYISSAMKQGSNLYARPATYLCYKSNRKRDAAKSAAKIARSCQHQNNNGSVCSCDCRIAGLCHQAISAKWCSLIKSNKAKCGNGVKMV